MTIIELQKLIAIYGLLNDVVVEIDGVQRHIKRVYIKGDIIVIEGDTDE